MNIITKTIIPNKYSYNLAFLLRNKGSIKAEKKEAVDKHTTATETLETFMDSKKKNQCIATRQPTNSNPKKSFFLIFVNSFLNNEASKLTLNNIFLQKSNMFLQRKILLIIVN